jgi:hypothetical protein
MSKFNASVELGKHISSGCNYHIYLNEDYIYIMH